MKPIASSITETSNLEGEEVKFKVSEASQSWVMRSLADLYSNRELAVIREYSTNAWDSNVEAAKAAGREPAPIHVTIPNALNPYFRVQDFGVGMSKAELKEVYTSFGESTKRNSNDVNGMLGFGSKSAVAYTTSFTITSIKDGFKNIGVVTRREDDMGGYLLTLKIIVDNQKTSEPNGVTIEVPVHNASEFAEKADQFYRFWQDGTVMINTQPNKRRLGEKIVDNIYKSETIESYVVMGNVAYRINNPRALFVNFNYIPFVAYVPIGSVEFTPNREALKYSDHTRNSLKSVVDELTTKAKATAVKEIESAKNHADAFESWAKWRGILGYNTLDDLKYKGDSLVSSIKLDDDLSQMYVSSYTRGNLYKIVDVGIGQVSTIIFVTNFSPNSVSSSHKKKMKDWVALKGRKETNFVILAKDIESVWIGENRKVDWEQIKQDVPTVKKTRAQSANAGRLAGSFDLYDTTTKRREYEKDVPSTKELYWVSIKAFNEYGRNGVQVAAEALGVKGFEVVLVPANRLDKFLRCYPHAKNIRKEARAHVITDGESLVPQAARDYYGLTNHERGQIVRLDASRIEDPEFKKLINEVKNFDDSILKEYRKAQNLAIALNVDFKDYGPLNRFVSRMTDGERNLAWEKILEKYPLLGDISPNYLAFNALNSFYDDYLNSIYRNKIKEGEK